MQSLLFRFIVATVVLLTFASCKTVEEPVPPEQEAIALLNQGEYKKAEYYLETLLEQEPDNDRYKVLLASAKVGYLKLNMVDWFNGFNDISKKLPKGLSLTGYHLDQPIDFARLLYSHVSMVIALITVVDGLPHINNADRILLVEAAKLLKGVPETSTEAEQAYGFRVLIDVYLIANHLRDISKSGNLHVNEQDPLSILCYGHIKTLVDSSYKSALRLDDAVDSLLVLNKINKAWKVEQYMAAQDKAKAIIRYYQDNRSTIDFVKLASKFNESSWCRSGEERP